MAEPKVRFKRDDGSSYLDLVDKKLGDIGKVLMCKRVFREQTDLAGDVPFYKIGTFGGVPDAFISRELYEELKSKYSFPKKGNVLLSAAGTIGRTVRYDGEDAFFQDSNIVWLDHDNSVLDDYLYYFYQQASWKNLEGGTIQRLYNGILLDKDISIPCIEEQQKIADFLSSVDEVISTSEQEVANLEMQKKAVIKKIFSQKVRFKRADGSDFPEWGKTTFGDIGASYKNSIVDGPFGSNLKTQDYTESGVLVFQSNYITSGSFSIGKPFFVSKEKAGDLKRCSAKSGDILIAKIGARFGMCDIIPPNIEGILSSNSMKIDLDSRVALNVFYKFYLRYLYDTKYHYREIGITAQPALSLSYIRELEVPIPCLEEQRLIADFLSDFDEAIAAAKKELELWKELKKGLLQQVFV